MSINPRRKYLIRAAVTATLLLAPGLGPAMAQSWNPPAPDPKAKDWVRLTSGEWLRGEVKLMRDLKVSFDSEELDLLELDWEDISVVRSPLSHTYVFKGGDYVTGPALIQEGVLAVRVGEKSLEYPRESILSIIEGQPRELDYWSLKASLGAVARAGNTDQSDVNAYVLLRRDATRSRFNVDYRGNFGKLDGRQNINNHNASLNLTLFIYQNLTLTPVDLEFFSDEFQNIDSRYTIAVGLGYYIFRKSEIEWNASLGFGYQATNFISVQAGEPDEESNTTLIPSTNFEADVTSDVEFTFEYGAQIGLTPGSNTFQHILSRLSTEITDILDMDVAIEWDHNENPTPSAEGVVPKQDDYRISFGLGIDI